MSSAASARRIKAIKPGRQQPGRHAGGGAGGKEHGPSPFARLADRIEDNLGLLLVKAEEILRENERHVLALAHALETHKTLSGEDVTAVFEGGRGPLVDGAPYADDAFIEKLREYHVAAERAHREHNQPQVSLPVAKARHTPSPTGMAQAASSTARSTGTAVEPAAPPAPTT